MAADYEYTGFVAQYWDLLRSASAEWDDREFYAELIARYGEPVLDVGCGTGRLLLDLLGRGRDVDGIDISPEMLDICEEKADALGIAIDVFQQAMEDLDLPREYATIIVASSAFQLIVDNAKAHRAMRRFIEHLRPGGVLVMPFSWSWSNAGQPATPDAWTSVTEVMRHDGAVIRRSSKAWCDLTEKLEHHRDLYEVVVDGDVVAAEQHERSPALRGYTQAEVVELFGRAGFHHLDLLDPVTLEAVTEDQRFFVAIGQKVTAA